MALTTTRILGEDTLAGTVVNAGLSTTGLSVAVQFRDTKTGAARTPQATTLLFTFDKDNERCEIIQADSHSTTNGVTTIVINASGRNLPHFGTGAGSGTGLVHDVGASCGSVILARPINELAANLVAKAGDTMTGPLLFSGTTNSGITTNSLTTTQRDALVGVANGTLIYNSTSGEEQVYQAGAWSTLASGSTQPNASTTVAGKVEIATDAELQAGTGTGGTGAKVVSAGDSFNQTPTANKVPVAGSDNKIDAGWIPNTTTNQQWITAAAGEAVDGSATPQLVYLSDGANSRTAGRFYKADADDTTNVSQLAVGFINENASSVGTTYQIKTGTVAGFTGLTAGALYYASTTAGGITATPDTGALLYSQKAIGIAISTTVLYCTPLSTKSVPYVSSGAVTTGVTTNLDVYTGYRARMVNFNLYMECPGGTSIGRYMANGNYDVSQATQGNSINAQGATVGTPQPLNTGAVICAGVGTNSCSLTFSIIINANFVRFRFVNAIVTTGGTGVYSLAANIIPY